MKTILKSVLAFSLLILLAMLVDRAFDSWRQVVEPRELRLSHGVVDTFVTTPFGESGLLVWGLVAAGSMLLLLLGGMASAARNRPIVPRAPSPQVEPSIGEGRRNRIISAAASAPSPQPETTPDDLTALFTLDRDVGSRKAWRLVPVGTESGERVMSTSWGGNPVMPEGLAWPQGRDDRPMLFLAQVDLAAFASPDNAPSTPGVPEVGTIFFFLDAPGPGDAPWRHSVIIRSPKEMTGSRMRTAPEGAVTPQDIGWSANLTAHLKFNPVRLEPYLDDDADTPVTKMFGVEVGDPFGFHFPEGFANLLFIEFSETFGTIGGHWTGMSIACAEADISRGVFDQGQVFGTNMG